MKINRTIEDFPIKKWELKETLTYKGNWVYNWFSNMIDCKLEVDGKLYRSSEVYYQCGKALNETQYEKIRNSNSFTAKKLAQQINNPNWEDVKFERMFKGLYEKCLQNPKFLEELKKHEQLIEWNNWSDKTWGVSVKDNLGRNALGVMLTYLKNNL